MDFEHKLNNDLKTPLMTDAGKVDTGQHTSQHRHCPVGLL